MTNREIFSLGPRLALCARLLRPGRTVADIGTDHGYLPIWLIKTGTVQKAIASDINPGPLDAARRHGEMYGVGDRLRLVLGDGLCGIGPEDAEDIVIAGMGGELILHIISGAAWLKGPGKRLVLQPMSAVDKLRAGLWQMGFAIIEELAAQESGKVYSAFSVEYSGELGDMDSIYHYMGRLKPGTAEVSAYAGKVLRGLGNSLLGAEHNGLRDEAGRLRVIIERVEREYLRQGEAHG